MIFTWVLQLNKYFETEFFTETAMKYYKIKIIFAFCYKAL